MRVLATTTARSDARRGAGIDRRTVGPALLVLALAVLMSVVLPAIDGATSYRDEIDKGDVAEIADGLTLVPTTGWDLATGALVGHTRPTRSATSARHGRRSSHGPSCRSRRTGYSAASSAPG
jgi:hypothetical protein